jgi:hypothetical protein
MQNQECKPDLLFTLCMHCDVVNIEANHHRNVYDTAEKRLTDLRKGGLEITDEAFQRILTGKDLFELDFYPQNACEGLQLVGEDLESILKQAILIARPWALANDPEELAATADEPYGTPTTGENATTDFLRIVELTKAGAGFSMNQHRTGEVGEPIGKDGGYVYRQQTARDALEVKSWADDDIERGIEEGKYDAMIEEDTIIDAYSYLNTPVGSYDVFHLNIRPCLRQLREIVENASVEVVYSGGLNVHMDKVGEFLGKEKE